MEKKLYFICTENKKPVGGIKQLYRQVDILNKNGFNAFIVHRKKGFRHKWFENETKIIYNFYQKKANLINFFLIVVRVIATQFC